MFNSLDIVVSLYLILYAFSSYPSNMQQFPWKALLYIYKCELPVQAQLKPASLTGSKMITCGGTLPREYCWHSYNRVIAQAFMCGLAH